MKKGKGILFVLLIISLISTPFMSIRAESQASDTETEPFIILSDDGKTYKEGSEEYTAESLSALFEELAFLDAKDVGKEKLIDLHDEYESLSLAAKTRVRGYDNLLAAEEALQITYTPREEKPDEGVKAGDSYRVLIEKERSVSLLIRYMTDKDGDGKADEAEITITSPDGVMTRIREGMGAAPDASSPYEVVFEDGALRLRIDGRTPGVYFLKADSMVCFMPEDAAESVTFLPEESEGEETKGEGSAKSRLPVILFAAATVLILLSPVLIKAVKKRRVKEETASDDELQEDEEEQIREYLRSLEKEVREDPDEEEEPSEEEGGSLQEEELLISDKEPETSSGFRRRFGR